MPAVVMGTYREPCFTLITANSPLAELPWSRPSPLIRVALGVLCEQDKHQSEKGEFCRLRGSYDSLRKDMVPVRERDYGAVCKPNIYINDSKVGIRIVESHRHRNRIGVCGDRRGRIRRRPHASHHSIG